MRPAGDALLSLKASVGPNGWGTSKMRQWKQGEGAGLAAGRRRGQARRRRHPTMLGSPPDRAIRRRTLRVRACVGCCLLSLAVPLLA